MTETKSLLTYLDENPFPASETDLNRAWDWLHICLEDFVGGDYTDGAQEILNVLKGLPVDGQILPGIGYQEISFDLIEPDIYPERGYTEMMVEVRFIRDTIIVPVASFAQRLEYVLDLYRQHHK